MALANAGRFAEAVAVGTAQNRVHPDEVLERLLVAWRIAALKSMQPAAPDPHWPPSDLQDPFPGLSGLPEIKASELTQQILAGAIVHHGGLLVRGFIPPEEAGKFKTGIDQAFAGFAAWLGTLSTSPVRSAFTGLTDWLASRRTPATRWFAPANMSGYSKIAKTRPWILAGAGTLAVDSPHLLFELVEMLERTGLVGMVEEYFAERPALSIGKTTLRKISASMNQTGWHQDGAFLGRQVRSVNLWLALSDCGRDASGLDLIPKRIPYILETGTHGASLDWVVGPGLVDQLTKDIPVYSPEFAAGDALLFDHLFLHRTGLPPNRTKDRWAIECWMFAPSCYPLDQGPLLL